MSDSEFHHFREHFGRVLQQLELKHSVTRSGTSILDQSTTRIVDDQSGSESDSDPLSSAAEVLGSAGLKLLTAGAFFFDQKRTRIHWQPDLERHIDEPGSGWQVTRTTVYLSPCELLYQLLGAASA